MNQIKKIIIILVIILIIIIICILNLNRKVNNTSGIEKDKNIEEDISGDFIKKMGLVNDYSTFFSIEKMINNYMKNVHSGNQETIYNLLDKDYIKQNNIVKEHILNHISEISQYDEEVRIRKIYSQENEQNAVYYIECMLEKEHQGRESYFGLHKDLENLTYSVEMLDKKTFSHKIENLQKKLERKQIEKNENNKILLVSPTEQEIATAYFEDILENALYYPEYTYNLLNAKYREKCFPTLQDFKEYIEFKRDIFESYDISNIKSYGDFENMDKYLLYLAQTDNLELEKYQIRNEGDYKKYTCIDSKGNYYMFYAISPMNYTVILDNYTIPTGQFIEEYNKSSEAEKVILNIKRFFMGIDDKNYGYSYSVLSESFKNNKYPTKNDFINYAKQNFFEENKIEYINYKKENGIYIYQIKLTDATGKNTGKKEFNIILKLNSGTDFEMSFGENK